MFGGQIAVAEDDASNYGGAGQPTFGAFQNTNGGFGFQSWSWSDGFFEDPSDAFLGNPTNDGHGDIGDPSFGLFSSNQSNSSINAFRSFQNPLADGQTFSTQFTINFRQGSKGLEIYVDGNGVFLFQATSFGGDKYEYRNTSGEFINTSWPYQSDSIFELSVTQINSTHVNISVTRTNSVGHSFTLSNQNVSGRVNEVRFFSRESGGNEQNLYFNNLQITSPSEFEIGSEWDSENDSVEDAIAQEGWRFISSPVAVQISALLNPIWTQTNDGENPGTGADDNESPNPNVYRFNNSTGAYEIVSDLNTPLTPGEGILVYVFARDEHRDDDSITWPKVLNVGEGSESPGDFATFPLTTGANAYNLVGNPFASAVEFGEFTTSGIREQVWVYDYSYTSGFEAGDFENTGDAGGGWRTLSGTIGSLEDGRIAAFQSFFVRNTEVDESRNLVAPRSAKTSEGAALYRGANQTPHLQLAARINNAQVSDLWVGFDNDATVSANRMDLEMLYPMDFKSFLSMYTSADNQAFDIKFLPTEFGEAISIPVYVEGWKPNASGTQYEPLSGNVELIWPKLENLPAEWTITITDNLTGETVNLREADRFEFSTDAAQGKRALEKKIGIHTVDMSEKNSAGSRLTLTITPEQPTDIPSDNQLPRAFALEQNYPNPFNPTTQIRYELPQASEVRLDIFNIQGQRVATLVNESRNAGSHTVSFDASALSSGVYLYRLQAGSQVFTRKMTLIK